MSDKVQIQVKQGPRVKVQTKRNPLPTEKHTAIQAEKDQSYLGGAVEDVYLDKDLREHIYSDPDTYAGSIAEATEPMWYMDDETGRMVRDNITFRECFYKLYDEILVNAMDQKERLSQLQKKNPELKGVKIIRVDTDIETGVISVQNDGEGLDVAMHPKFKAYIPEMVFGHLLTSTNYAKDGKGLKRKDRTVGGKNGYGAKITNIFSKEFTIETVDSARKLLYRQTWRDNMTVCEEPVIERFTKRPYTRITYLPDYARFNIKNPAVLDDWKLIHKRAYDASACLGTGVSVYLNGKRIAVKNFEDYMNLYIGPKSETKRAYIEVNDRWQVGVCLNTTGEFEQVSFVNGICTDRGGKHVTHVTDNLASKIIKGMSEAQKKKFPLKPAQVKKNIFVFLKSTIAGPNFDTQTKRKLTTLVSEFGSRCDLPEEFIKKASKIGILDRAKKLADYEERTKLGKKTNGKPRAKRVVHEKLVDARAAGGNESSKCTIVFTEGDSAATFMGTGMNGIPMAERAYWGWFPLRGKMLNTRTATLKQLKDNEEIKMIKQIIGLEEGKEYPETGELKLRYGRVMLLTDADKDGSHIKGLGFNYFEQNFPSLLKREGFICDFSVPINKAYRTNGKGEPIKSTVREFFSPAEYAEWEHANGNGKGWTVNYYKGLGTYEAPEVRELCKNMRITHYIWNDEQVEERETTADSSTHKFDLAFSKKLADARKEWVNNEAVEYIVPEQGKITRITYDYFIDNQLKQFSIADNVRSIPSLVDGLKPSQRKVLFAAFKRKLKEKVKVAQFAGYISEHTAYQHGETALFSTIIKMAQDYVGSNNVNLLAPSGAFGTRIGSSVSFKKGDDHASPRYIFTFLSQITNVLFNKDDMPLLDYLVEEGQKIEPRFYTPILPVVLLNGAEGIGTGYSTSIPGFNPAVVASNTRACIRGEEMTEMLPYYRGYRGQIHKLGENKYVTVGVYRRDPINRDKIRITELPVGHKNCKSFTGYKEFLNGLLDDDVAKEHGIVRKKTAGRKKTDGENEDDSTKSLTFRGSVIMDYEVISSTDVELIVDITFKPGVLDKELANNDNFRFEKKMKLAHAFTVKNMHLYDAHGRIKKYDSPHDIIREFCEVRRPIYVERRERLLRKYQHDINKAEAKYRFVVATMDETIDLRHKKKAVAVKILEDSTPPYPKYATNVDDSPDKASYEYLLSMRIDSVTEEMLEKLLKDIERAQAQKAELEAKTEVDIWEEDITDFTAACENDLQAWYKYHNIKPIMPRKKVALKSKTPVLSTVGPGPGPGSSKTKISLGSKTGIKIRINAKAPASESEPKAIMVKGKVQPPAAQ